LRNLAKQEIGRDFAGSGKRGANLAKDIGRERRHRRSVLAGIMFPRDDAKNTQKKKKRKKEKKKIG
jgi:hypothetical protein